MSNVLTLEMIEANCTESTPCDFVGSRTVFTEDGSIVEIRCNNKVRGWCSNEVFERMVELCQ